MFIIYRLKIMMGLNVKCNNELQGHLEKMILKVFVAYMGVTAISAK